MVSFCPIGIGASPAIASRIWKGNYFQGREISPRLHNSGHPKIYP